MLVDGGLDVRSRFWFRYPENKVPKLLQHELALVVFIVLSLFNVLFALSFFWLFLLVLVFSEENYKLQAWWWRFWRYNELGASTVVGGLFSCGKPQPISSFVSDEAAARLTETWLQSLTPSKKLTKAVSLPSVITAKQLLVIESFDALI